MERQSTRWLLTCCAGLVPGVVLVAAAPAAAQPAPPSLAVEVEIAEQVRGGGRGALALTLTLVGDRGCAAVQVRREPVRHDVQVCREGGDAAAPVLAFTIERSESSPRGHGVSKFRVTSRLAAGKRAVVGRAAHADGGGTLVTATAR